MLLVKNFVRPSKNTFLALASIIAYFSIADMHFAMQIKGFRLSSAQIKKLFDFSLPTARTAVQKKHIPTRDACPNTTICEKFAAAAPGHKG